jgi:hypothetical protein
MLIAFVVGFVYVSDPYVYYHKEGIYNRTFAKNFNMRYQIPGMIRNLDYETLFVGTSMVHNFEESGIDQVFHTTSFNASISGSSAREQRKAAELAIASKNIKHIFWEINFDSLAGDSDRIDATFPKYLYDRNVFNDYPYLLSYDALKKIDYQIKNRKNLSANVDPYSFYKFGSNNEPLTVEKMEAEIKGLSAPPYQDHNQKKYMKSFEDNILDMVKKHPDIQFTFFYTPYPITRHVVVDESDSTITNERLNTKLAVFDELKEYKNAEVFDFQDEQDVTFNVGNYMDRSHYFPYINEWMLKEMANKESIGSHSVYEAKVKNFREQIKNFSVSQLREEPKVAKK